MVTVHPTAPPLMTCQSNTPQHTDIYYHSKTSSRRPTIFTNLNGEFKEVVSLRSLNIVMNVWVIICLEPK